jgi:hypothetical protein
MAGEWRHRTITGTVLAAPKRVRLLGAKLLSYAVAGAVLSLVVTVTAMAAGLLILSARGETTIGVADLADVLWRNLLVAALLGGLGVLVGGLVRNQVAAIVGLLIFTFALEPAVIGLMPEVGRFGPTVGAPNGILSVNFFDDEGLLEPAPALLVMLAWLGAGFAATAAMLRSRDLV